MPYDLTTQRFIADWYGSKSLEDQFEFYAVFLYFLSVLFKDEDIQIPIIICLIRPFMANSINYKASPLNRKKLTMKKDEIKLSQYAKVKIFAILFLLSLGCHRFSLFFSCAKFEWCQLIVYSSQDILAINHKRNAFEFWVRKSVLP